MSALDRPAAVPYTGRHNAASTDQEGRPVDRRRWVGAVHALDLLDELAEQEQSDDDSGT